MVANSGRSLQAKPLTAREWVCRIVAVSRAQRQEVRQKM